MALDAAELAELQADLVAVVCDKTCEIWRATVAADGLGTKSKTYARQTTTVAGLAQPTGTQLQNYAFEIEALATWQVHLPISTDVRTQDHLVIDSQTLEVHILLNPRSYAGLLTVHA
jgi:hypothetical protein